MQCAYNCKSYRLLRDNLSILFLLKLALWYLIVIAMYLKTIIRNQKQYLLFFSIFPEFGFNTLKNNVDS